MRLGSACLLALAANMALFGRVALAEEPVAQAQTASAEEVAAARAAFWEAHQRYTAGNYREAVALFERSYAIYPQNEVLFNIALAHAKSGDCGAAHQTLQQHLSANPEESAREQARAKFESADTPCSFDPEPSLPDASPPTPPPVAAPPGPTPVSPSPEPPPPLEQLPSPQALDPSDTRPSSYWTGPRVFGWSLVGAGAIAAGAAIYFDERRRDASEEARQIASDNPSNAGDRVSELEADYNRARTLTGITAVGAGAFTLAGVGLLLLGANNDSSASVAIDRQGDFQLRLRGRF
jgi:tetratricopeptide (TPR) repeat protein